MIETVDWILEVGTFHCERDDCPKGPKPCSFCNMPSVDKQSEDLMSLYQRCAQRHCLPEAGGLMDQDETLMRSFDVIDERISLFRKKQRENSERQEALTKLSGDIRHGR